MQYEKKKAAKYSQGEEDKIVQFLYFSLSVLCLCFVLGENMYIFYEKEVVLRAYVYSSDFINRRDNWSTYSRRCLGDKRKREKKKEGNQMRNETA